MTATVSKRQQARNERTLQDLLRGVPGNSTCADCGAKNPGWASWSLGMFLCMRCAALHRKLGTHISKIKSLSMDSWSGEQVDNMKKVGNAAGNKLWNPSNVEPPLPVDVDDVEAALEKFIRQKYEHRALAGGALAQGRVAVRQNTGSTSTGSLGEVDQPPPLPPKPGKRFGFSLRSSSSHFPRPRHDRFTPPLSPTFSGNSEVDAPASPLRANKPAKIFGAVISGTDNNFDVKLATLRDMGFGDNRRNSEVLQNMDGNVDRAIKSLVQEGGNNIKAASRALTPVSMSSGPTSGLAIERTRQPEKKAQSNPWEARESAPAAHQQRAATQPLPLPPSNDPLRQQATTPSNPNWNPFTQQAPQVQPQQNLENSFQNLQVSQPPLQQQQHFIGDSNQMLPQWQNGLFQSSYIPQLQAEPQQIQLQPTGIPYAQSFQQQAPEAQQPQYARPQLRQQQSNPFLRTSRSQTFTRSNPWVTQQVPSPQPQPQQTNAWAIRQVPSPQPQLPQTTPFGNTWQQQSMFQQPATAPPAPIYGQQADYLSALQSAQQSVQQVGPQIQQPSTAQDQARQQNYILSNRQENAWQQSTQQMPLQPDFIQPAFQQSQAQQQPNFNYPQQSAQAARHDKTSILALYNYPQLVPSRALQSLPEDSSVNPMSAPASLPKQRSHTMPLSAMQNNSSIQNGYYQTGTLQFGSNNPFASAQTSAVSSAGNSRHVSQESMDFLGMSGRQSPDAFAGLSSRFVR